MYRVNEAIELVKSRHGVFFVTVFNDGKAIITDHHYPVPGHNATVHVYKDGQMVRSTSVSEGTHD